MHQRRWMTFSAPRIKSREFLQFFFRRREDHLVHLEKKKKRKKKERIREEVKREQI